MENKNKPVEEKTLAELHDDRRGFFSDEVLEELREEKLREGSEGADKINKAFANYQPKRIPVRRVVKVSVPRRG
ncbi:MAG TPA: hypothetical protein VI819_03850 [Patescibacteria group bacterium]|nr:hypothetical protein [Patescibacteria group bacterium]